MKPRRNRTLVAAALLGFACQAAEALDSDRVIVRLRGGAPLVAHDGAQRERIAARLSRGSGELMRPLRVMGDGAQVMQLFRRLPAARVAALQAAIGTQDEEVVEIVPDRIFFPALTPSDPLFATQWSLGAADGINAPAAWDLTTGAANLIVGIVDTGKLAHDELAGRWIGGYDFVSLAERANDGGLRDADATDPGDWVTSAESAAGPLANCPVTDSRWHGTAMAGIVAANANNALGIAGINWGSKLLPVRVVGKCGGYESDIADGMRWAAGVAVPGVPGNANVADVLNVSLSAAGSCSSTLQSAVNEVVAAGVPVIVAAGNNSLAASGFSPGNCTGVVTVGAVDRNGGKPAYANFGPPITVAAPGGIAVIASGTPATHWVTTPFNAGTTVADPGTAYLKALNGTSVAAAHATGVASLMLSVNPSLSPQAVGEIVRGSARLFPQGTTALGSQADCTIALCGDGILDARAAVSAAAAWGHAAARLSGGENHTLALRSDGTMFSWGANESGQLAQAAASSLPLAIAGMNGVVRIAAGHFHSVALRSDGSVWTWGRNDFGQLGDGTLADRAAPARVYGVAGMTQVAANRRHTLALRSDGTVWAWGGNSEGQLGDGTLVDRATPVPVGGLANVTAIAAGAEHSLALKSDGTVWAWGDNELGSLGDGTTTDHIQPAAVAGLTGVIAIDAGPYFSLALKGDGTVWAWGKSPLAGLGDGTSSQRNSPVQVEGLGNIIAIAAGSYHALALRADGTVWGWGYNFARRLGDGTDQLRLTPVQAQVSGVVAIEAGSNTSFVILSDGTARAFGLNYSGELGIGTTSPPSSPTLVPYGAGNLVLDFGAVATFTPLSGAAQGSVQVSNTIVIGDIAVGSAVGVSGGEYRIDSGSFTAAPGTINPGQLLSLRLTASAACGTTSSATVSIAGTMRTFSVTTAACDTTPDPITFAPLADVAIGATVTSAPSTITGINAPAAIAVAGGQYSIGCGATFVATPGSVNAGDSVCLRVTAAASTNTTATATLTVGGISAPFHATTAPAAGFTTAAQLSGGDGFTLALRTDGRLFSWGSDNYGQAAQAGNSTLPLLVGGLTGVSRIAAGTSHGVALRSDGSVWTWGRNDFGQLGDGTLADRPSPVRVAGLASVVAVAANRGHTLALKADGTIWAWGRNNEGQLGDGTSIDRLQPVQVAGIAAVTAIAAGAEHSVALKGDGTVWAWGDNELGSLGDGTVTDRVQPAQVPGLAGATAIAAGPYFSLALKADGTVWSWGKNPIAGLGDGTTSQRNSPVQVDGLSNVIAIAAGGSHGLALRADGTLWAWGYNFAGRLGDGTQTLRLSPVQAGIFGSTVIGAGANSTFAITGDGSVRAWGFNSSGELGVGNTQHQLLPVAVPYGSGNLVLDFGAVASFVSVANAAPGSLQVSNTIVMGPIAAGSSVNVTGGEYRIDSGAFTSAPGTIGPGQLLTLRRTASAACGASTSVTVSVAGTLRSFTITTAACDTAPDPITFPPLANVTPGATVTSAARAVTGINTSTPISVTGGQYSIGCTATFVATAGTIDAGETICLRVVAAASANTTATATVTIGTGVASFHATTAPPAGFTATARLSGGEWHTLALRSDGTVFSWGSNLYGQIAQAADSNVPLVVAGLTGVSRIAAGAFYSVALRSDGSVWAWGRNDVGQLGDGTLANRPVPVRIEALSNVTAIAASRVHTLALKANGTVWAWGDNEDGQLGDATRVSRLQPVQVAGFANGVAVAAGGAHSLALRADGTVWAWGYNQRGSLGDGTTTDSLLPVQVVGLAGITAIDAGTTFSLALRNDGTVWAWGQNALAGLGDGTASQRNAPVQVTGLANIVAIAAGTVHALALRSDGTMWSWGFNFPGRLGDGTSEVRLAPVQVLLAGTVSIEAGSSTSFAIAADGSVRAWGFNSSGELGIGNRSHQALPVALPAIDPDDELLRLLASDTRPRAFAFLPSFGVPRSTPAVSNAITVLGMSPGAQSPVTVSGGEVSVNGGTFTAAPPPVLNGDQLVARLQSAAAFATTTSMTVTIGGASGESAGFYVRTAAAPDAQRGSVTVAAGDSHTYMLGSQGTPFSTGYNGNGQLGNGTTLGLSVFRAVAGLGDAVAVASGGFHGLALRRDKSVVAWGWNAVGQLGTGAASGSQPTFAAVPGLTDVASVAAGRYHSLAVKVDGSVRAWGMNADGQVGDGTTAPMRPSPTAVAGLSNVIAVAAGGRHSLALTLDGRVWAWGANESGQLGDGTTTQRSVAAQVPGLANVVAIAAGDAHSLALRANGSVVAWGFNAFGQLGDGSTGNRLAPVAVTGLGSGVGLVAAGANHSLAVRAGGALYAWGNNSNSQVGNGNNANQLAPVLLALPTGVVAVAGGARHSAAIDSGRRLHLWGDNFFGQVGNRSGNYSPHSASLNVLRGDAVISTSAGGTGSSVGTGSNSGSSVLLIDGLGTGFDFGTRSPGSSVAIAGRYANQSAEEPINDVSLGTSGDGFALAGTDCPGTLEPLAECGFTIEFTPSGSNSYYGELVVSSSVVGSPERRALLGTGIPPAAAAVAFTGGGVDFPPQETGTLQASILGVVNRGTAPLTGSDPVASTLGDFSAIHNCYNITPGASCEIQVRFTPQAVGARSAQLSFASNASGSPHSIAVFGTGVATPAPTTYALNVARAGSGSGSVSSSPGGISCGAACSATYAEGTSVTLSAIASSGSIFAGWGGACSDGGTCTVTMNSPRSVTATFNETAPIPSPRPEDFNGDGRSDLLYYNNVTGQVWRFLVNGFTLSSGAMVHVEPDTSWKIVSDADFNGDGRNDLLWRNANSGQVYLMTMGATGLPNESRLIYTEPNPAWKIVHTPDFDGDGKADLLWWNSTTGQVYVMLMDGFAAKAQGFVYTEPNTAWKIAVVGDFSGSGKKNQLMWRNSSTGQVYLMTINYSGGAITQTGQMIYQEPNTAWNIIGANDFNGDGKSDLLWRNESTGQVYLMLMNGGTIASQGMLYTEPNLTWKIVAQGDYDGDGKADLLWRNESSGHVYMMLMNGLTVANAAMVYYEPSTSWKVMGAAAYAQ